MERITAAEFRQLMEKKQSKYRAKKTEVDGIKFDSQLEANYYSELKILQRIGEVCSIQLQPKFVLQEPNGKERGITYVADFLVTYSNGRQEIIDCKGVFTAVYRLKKKLFAEKYPHLKIKEVS